MCIYGCVAGSACQIFVFPIGNMLQITQQTYRNSKLTTTVGKDQTEEKPTPKTERGKASKKVTKRNQRHKDRAFLLTAWVRGSRYFLASPKSMIKTWFPLLARPIMKLSGLMSRWRNERECTYSMRLISWSASRRTVLIENLRLQKLKRSSRLSARNDTQVQQLVRNVSAVLTLAAGYSSSKSTQKRETEKRRKTKKQKMLTWVPKVP